MVYWSGLLDKDVKIMNQALFYCSRFIFCIYSHCMGGRRSANNTNSADCRVKISDIAKHYTQKDVIFYRLLEDNVENMLGQCSYLLTFLFCTFSL